MIDNRGKLLPDFIGKLENLAEDFTVIAGKTGFVTDGLLHLNNAGRGKSYREYYDQEAREMVAERYRRDIEMFNYEF